MKDYDRILESLNVKFIKAGHMKVLQALKIENFYDVDTTLILLNKGKISYTQGKVQDQVAPGEMLFIPGGKSTDITYGGENPIITNQEYFTSNYDQYLQAVQAPDFEVPFENFSYVTFDAKAFDLINFFTALGIPPFVIRGNTYLRETLKNILIESCNETVGNNRMVKAYTEQLGIQIVRHVIANNLFTEKLATSNRSLKDPRLISILHYIKDNLGGDLSNQTLATVAHVSRDYVGQYFKMLTGINPQDHIEYQRMEQAVKLLRTTKKSVREIGQAVGFKDTAYFCRRFKMMFGMPASKSRQKETKMSIPRPTH